MYCSSCGGLWRICLWSSWWWSGGLYACGGGWHVLDGWRCSWWLEALHASGGLPLM
uniref:Uncharacterized protein n=1 Tax=Meloidogyne enterolobii TaxID=390850 RepID=A0A6V7XI64_MELEN|nr:unnamed protein product [Meloidogyne enterolobii]